MYVYFKIQFIMFNLIRLAACHFQVLYKIEVETFLKHNLWLFQYHVPANLK